MGSTSFPKHTLVRTLAAIALLAGASNAACTTNQRKSWNNLSSDEKSEYIEAELCLMAQPPKVGISGAENLWDEIHWSHLAQVSFIHGVGAFLPWHRYYMTVHEELLRSECNYTGSQPYWDEVGDQDAFPNLDLFDPDTGFGGNGSSSTGCITDGPFANLTLRFQRDGSVDEYCLTRKWSEDGFAMGVQENVDECQAQESFIDAWNCFEDSPHSAGHAGVGGIMANAALSPGDPLFFLHHAYLDKVWWEWQQANSSQRLTEIGGQNVGSGISSAAQVFSEGSFTNYDGDPSNVTTLNHTLWVAELLPNITLGEVMDLHGDAICAEYI